MIISRKNRFIFSAFNKTGTTSIESVLAQYNSRVLYHYLKYQYKRTSKDTRMFKHIRPSYVKEFLGDGEWDKYFTFSFVRNPWGRTVSLYCFHRKDPVRRPLAQKTFEEWLHAGGTGTVRRSMSEFVCDDDGNVVVDYIGKYENLAKDFREVCRRARLPEMGLPQLNRSTDGDYRKHYTSETRDIVAEWAKRDIEMFGYEF